MVPLYAVGIVRRSLGQEMASEIKVAVLERQIQDGRSPLVLELQHLDQPAGALEVAKQLRYQRRLVVHSAGQEKGVGRHLWQLRQARKEQVRRLTEAALDGCRQGLDAAGLARAQRLGDGRPDALCFSEEGLHDMVATVVAR